MSTFREPVVAKVLTYTDDTWAAARMWLQETRIHSKVGSEKHQAIIQLLGVDARVHAFYMEAVQASPLGDKSFRDHHGHFSGTNNNAERILNDMVSALSWVHGLGVVHNDIKPANILFGKTRGAVLIDFGLSTDTPREVSKVDGTPWHLPPEFLKFKSRRLAKSVSSVSFVILFTAQLGRFGFLIISSCFMAGKFNFYLYKW
ncbi:hypothetical protein PoMZ_13687 [Pyricularia oryzae]|uniref:Protein kinase domain-containing protein n=1 Tax=Pyricularia oryzae TaxID=318829 RepID=A0A4P7NW44_PYROR|nr:hypothetical protein PoMZ_13687 [Pyricularia oryzae]